MAQAQTCTRQQLVTELSQYSQKTKEHQLLFDVSETTNGIAQVTGINLTVGDKHYQMANTTENMNMLGNVLLDLSKMNQFDRIIRTKMYSYGVRYVHGWMRSLLTDDFTSLIQTIPVGCSLKGIPDAETYNLLCEMITRDKMITVSIAFDRVSTLYDSKGKKWRVDESKLLNAIKSTNTLKEIYIGGWDSNWSPEPEDIAMEKLLKEALSLNFSVTSLTREDNRSSGGIDVLDPGIHGFSLMDSYSKWWPAIKKRNEESQKFNKIIFGDDKDDGIWNNNKCPFDIAQQVLQKYFPSIPALFFDKKGDKCFCMKCHSQRKDKLHYSRGQPPKRYTLPIEWVRFGLKTNEAKCAMNNVWSHWHVAFHGTVKEIVPQIFQAGLILLKPGDVTIKGTKLPIRGGHISKPFERFNKYTSKKELFDPNQIYISPSIKYSGHGAYARKFYCSHPQNKNRTLLVQCVFQLRIRPGSYGIGQETVGAARMGKPLDASFSNNELEWYTTEHVGIVLHGLLFRIKEINVPLKQLTKKEVYDHDEKKDI
eukprot:948229_1